MAARRSLERVADVRQEWCVPQKGVSVRWAVATGHLPHHTHIHPWCSRRPKDSASHSKILSFHLKPSSHGNSTRGNTQLKLLAAIPALHVVNVIAILSLKKITNALKQGAPPFPSPPPILPSLFLTTARLPGSLRLSFPILTPRPSLQALLVSLLIAASTQIPIFRPPSLLPLQGHGSRTLLTPWPRMVPSLKVQVQIPCGVTEVGPLVTLLARLLCSHLSLSFTAAKHSKRFRPAGL